MQVGVRKFHINPIFLCTNVREKYEINVGNSCPCKRKRRIFLFFNGLPGLKPSSLLGAWSRFTCCNSQDWNAKSATWTIYVLPIDGQTSCNVHAFTCFAFRIGHLVSCWGWEDQMSMPDLFQFPLRRNHSLDSAALNVLFYTMLISHLSHHRVVSHPS